MTQIAVTTILLASLTLVGLLYSGIPRLLIWVQVGYWAVSYVIRPAILLYVVPAPRLGDSVADPRLALDAYTAALSEVLTIVDIGLGVYLGTLILIRAIFRHRITSVSVGRARPVPGLFATLGISWIIGWVGRIGVVAGGSNAFLDLLGYLAVAGAFGLLLRLPATTRASRILLVVVASSEVLWAVASASKTPLMSAALALLLRMFVIGEGRRGVKVAAILGVTFLMFPLIQALKIDARVGGELSAADAAYPIMVRPFLSLVRRFDLLSAATDAMYLGPGNWISVEDFWGRALAAFVPTPLLSGQKTFAGQAWADEVRSFSTGSLGGGVSLADGFIAEGWALAGVWGIVLESVVLAALLFFAAWAVGRATPALVGLGGCLLTYPILFERGMLGSFSVLGKSLQAALIIWLIGLVVRELARRSARQQAMLTRGLPA